MCGEKGESLRASTMPPGSPPHVRGKDIPAAQAVRGSGITPACAGKRLWPLPDQDGNWDHPRMCGEKASSGSCSFGWQGSPPHVRGKERHHIGSDGGGGITPACAGKREGWRRRGRGLWDHPRMCGEKTGRNALKLSCLGSPPHVRGKGKYFAPPDIIRGITPACAGKRHQKEGHLYDRRDHPRMCGEKGQSGLKPSYPLGSPPHVRGKAASSGEKGTLQGITPACAGKSR